jgi:hypothetical protein
VRVALAVIAELLQSVLLGLQLLLAHKKTRKPHKEGSAGVHFCLPLPCLSVWMKLSSQEPRTLSSSMAGMSRFSNSIFSLQPHDTTTCHHHVFTITSQTG